MKKLLSVITVLILLISSAFVTTAFADTDSVTLAADTVTTRPGAQVQVALRMTENDGTAGLTVTLKYDTDVLTVTNAVNGTMFSGFSYAKNAVWDNDRDITSTGTLATFTFAIAEDAEDGDYAIEIIPRSCTDTDLRDVACQVTHGKITVVSSCEHTNAYELAGSAPTCSQTGLTAGKYCPDCETTLIDRTEIPTTGHSFTAKTMTDEYLKSRATCTEAAAYYYSCSVCGAKGEQTFTGAAAPGHDYQSVLTPATCTADGYTTYTCSRCKDVRRSDPVKATGHKWDGGRITTEPTADKEGVKTFTCLTCGSVKTEKTAAQTVKEPTVKEPTVKEPTVNTVPGDIDGDGKVSAADARLALRTSVGLKGDKDAHGADIDLTDGTGAAFRTADVDHDGKITAADARLILRASVGIEDPSAWRRS